VVQQVSALRHYMTKAHEVCLFVVGACMLWSVHRFFHTVEMPMIKLCSATLV